MKRECVECGENYEEGSKYYCKKYVVNLQSKGWKLKQDGLLTKGEDNST